VHSARKIQPSIAETGFPFGDLPDLDPLRANRLAMYEGKPPQRAAPLLADAHVTHKGLSALSWDQLVTRLTLAKAAREAALRNSEATDDGRGSPADWHVSAHYDGKGDVYHNASGNRKAVAGKVGAREAAGEARRGSQ